MSNRELRPRPKTKTQTKTPKDAMLPIEKHFGDILRLIDANKISSVEAGTGSGKSTKIAPLFVIDSKRTKRVLVIQPTIVACRKTCEYVRKSYPQLRVGLAAGGVNTYNDKTEIVFVTGGYAEMKFGQSHNFNQFDLVILDEVHTTSIEYEVLTLMLQNQYHNIRSRILLLSATMLTTIIESWSRLIQAPLPSFQLDVKLFPIKETFWGKSFQIGHSGDERDLITQTIEYLAIQNVMQPKGHFLVFCSGREVIDKMYNELFTEKYNDRFKNCYLYCAYSSMPNEQIDEAFSQKMAHDNKRSIIFATDIAETSITIQGLVLVVCMGQQKQMQCRDGETSVLTTVRVSKFAAIQRRGRTGRTNPGTCHRMYTKEEYDALEPCYQSALQRTPLHQTVLRLISYDFDPKILLLGITTESAIAACIQSLEAQTLIVRTKDGKYQLSEEAKQICYLPLALSFARCLYLLFTIESDLLVRFVGLVTIAIAEVESSASMVYLPRRNRDEPFEEFSRRLQEHQKLYTRFEEHSVCPLNSAVNAYLAYETETQNMNYRQHVAWTVRFGMNNKTMIAVSSLVTRLLGQCNAQRVTIKGLVANQVVASVFETKLSSIFAQRFKSYYDELKDAKWYEDQMCNHDDEFYRLNNRGFGFNLAKQTTRVMCLHKAHSEKTDGYVARLISLFIFVPGKTRLQEPEESNSSDTSDSESADYDYYLTRCKRSVVSLSVSKDYMAEESDSSDTSESESTDYNYYLTRRERSAVSKNDEAEELD